MVASSLTVLLPHGSALGAPSSRSDNGAIYFLIPEPKMRKEDAVESLLKA